MIDIVEIRNPEQEIPALAKFLAEWPGETRTEDSWKLRLQHWWILNPAARSRPGELLGWRLIAEDRTVGFLGLIPTDYQCDGEKLNAHAATTWRVDPEFRSSSLPMLLKLRSLSREVPIVDTSPSETVNELFDRLKISWGPPARERVFPMLPSLLMPGGGSLKKGHTVLSSLHDVASFEVAESSSQDLEKRYSFDYLKWLVDSPNADLLFYGLLDSENTLQACLLFEKASFRRLPGIRIIDWLSSASDPSALRFLFGRLLRTAGSTHGIRSVICSLTTTGIESQWTPGFPPSLSRETKQKQRYALPANLADRKNRFVIAEGDFGL